MKTEYKIKPIGYVKVSDTSFSIQVEREFWPALSNLEGFSHLTILWWGHLSKRPQEDGLVIGKLFKNGPNSMGVFSTRSPHRPNPILVSTIEIQSIDFDQGIIETLFIDAENDTPVLDIKPYFPMDRVKVCQTPEWCQHWPKWFEDFSTYNWMEEIVK
jgi:tRNA-Thr(GGU) m(6)t(6)A37 methyltransferase TsaA